MSEVVGEAVSNIVSRIVSELANEVANEVVGECCLSLCALCYLPCARVFMCSCVARAVEPMVVVCCMAVLLSVDGAVDDVYAMCRQRE